MTKKAIAVLILLVASFAATTKNLGIAFSDGGPGAECSGGHCGTPDSTPGPIGGGR